MLEAAMNKLRARLDSLNVATQADFVEYIAHAARLAALGDDSYLRGWPDLAKRAGVDMEKLLQEQVRTGIVKLEQATGVLLGEAVLMAQDFRCFVAREREILPESLRVAVTAWADAAERAPLDDDAAEHLRAFLREFPLPEEYRLPVVDTPLTEFEWSLAAATASPPTMEELQWPAVQVDSEQYEPVSYDALHPSDRLKRQFERLEVPFRLLDGTEFCLTRQLDDDWRVVFSVDFGEGGRRRVQSVRLGMLPGIPTDDGDAWIVDLRPFEHMARVALLDETVGIRFQEGHSVLFTRSA